MDIEKEWYAVHTYSGYENNVKTNLEKRLESMGMSEEIFRVVVPTEEEIQSKDGKRKTVTRKIFPGYVLVEMIMTDKSWYVVRNTPGVTGFVGAGSKPVPLSEQEVNRLLGQMGEIARVYEINVEVGENVKIKSGPFADFVGKVEEVSTEQGKIWVLVSMFGRETPLELDFNQVEKVQS